ncbi:hypothetical protein NSQ91_13985 [Paenibacillus sp. FSL R7-0048]|uniref:hypothetical protein n=1 Tax=Paenibacillus sp. FSL R7-0048 TaxID=2954528 RepID=UPI0030F7A50D
MTQRDWQKDMDLVQGTIKHDAFPAWTEPMLYWLQEAKELQEIVSGRGREILRLRSLLGGLNDELTATEDRADAAEAREQQLKDAVQLAVNDLELWSDKTLAAKVVLGQLQRTLSTLYPDTPAPTPEIKQQFAARPLDEWHEEMGDMLWWMFPIQEPPYCGNPLDSDWSDCYTHWTPIVIPADPAPKEGEHEI